MISRLYSTIPFLLFTASSFFFPTGVSAEEEDQKNEENCADEKERKVFEDKKGERRTELIFRDPNQPAKPAPEPKPEPEPKPAPEPPKNEPEPKPAEPEPKAEPKPAEPAPAPAKDPQKEAPVPAEANKDADAADGNATVVEGNASGPAQPFLPSDFFSGALEAAGQSDPMGTQRLIDVKSGLTPSIAFSTSYNYSSNPIKVPKDSAGHIQDGFNAMLNLSVNMGLGEYGVGDDVLVAPAFMLMHMRTYNDPVNDYGGSEIDGSLKVFDVDVQIAGVTVPIIFPNDYTLTLGHSYARPISFRNDNVISYSNTPNVSLTKTLPLETGDVLTLTLGTSFAFTSGDTLEQQINDTNYFNFIKEVMRQGGTDPLSQQPVNLQDAWTHTLALSYIRPFGEKLTLTPTLAASMMQYTEGANVTGGSDREDLTYIAGLNASYLITEWLNVSAAANQMWKRTNRTDLSGEYEDFLGGVTIGFNFSF